MTDSLGRLAIIAGGLSHEREVSLWSARRLKSALHAAGVEAAVYDADRHLLTKLELDGVEVAIPHILGAGGEDGSLQTVLELSGLPYVGSTSSACRAAWNKAIAGTVLAKAGLRVPKGAALPVQVFRDLGSDALVQRMVDALGLPLVVKPCEGGSALGQSAAATAADLPSALVKSFAYTEDTMVQEFILGRDISVGVLERDGVPTALEPIELQVAEEDHFDFAARYTPDLISLQVAELPDETKQAMQDMAVAAHRALDLRDWSRSDFVLREDGTPYLLEVALVPAVLETSPYPFGLTASGLGLADTVLALVDAAKKRHASA